MARPRIGQALSDHQLAPYPVELQKAAAVLHRRMQLLEAARFLVSVALSIAALALTLVAAGGALLSIIGLAWTLVSIGLMFTARRTLLYNAVICQEMFDTEIFGLLWNRGLAGAPLLDYEVHGLARALPSGSPRAHEILEGWYP